MVGAVDCALRLVVVAWGWVCPQEFRRGWRSVRCSAVRIGVWVAAVGNLRRRRDETGLYRHVGHCLHGSRVRMREAGCWISSSSWHEIGAVLWVREHSIASNKPVFWSRGCWGFSCALFCISNGVLLFVQLFSLPGAGEGAV